MIDLFLQIALLGSLAIIVYLMALAVPRVKDEELSVAKNGRLTGRLSLEQIDDLLNRWKDKLLRRLRIYLLRAEYFVSRQLDKSKELYKKK